MPIDIPMRFESEPLLLSVPDVYTARECERFVSLIEAGEPSLATNNPLYRDQDRIIRDDPRIAEELFSRLRPHLPAMMGPPGSLRSLRLLGLNERLRMYRYRPGQRFAPHTDHWYQPSANRITLYTVLVYFNDDFEGGETRFCDELDETIVPRRGLTAIFQHKLRHEGCPVRRGTKYAMRSDVLYEADEAIRTPGLEAP
jgi:hypothetical protein